MDKSKLLDSKLEKDLLNKIKGGNSDSGGNANNGEGQQHSDRFP